MKIDFFMKFWYKNERSGNNDANTTDWIRKQNMISFASLIKSEPCFDWRCLIHSVFFFFLIIWNRFVFICSRSEPFVDRIVCRWNYFFKTLPHKVFLIISIDDEGPWECLIYVSHTLAFLHRRHQQWEPLLLSLVSSILLGLCCLQWSTKDCPDRLPLVFDLWYWCPTLSYFAFYLSLQSCSHNICVLASVTYIP